MDDKLAQSRTDLMTLQDQVINVKEDRYPTQKNIKKILLGPYFFLSIIFIISLIIVWQLSCINREDETTKEWYTLRYTMTLLGIAILLTILIGVAYYYIYYSKQTKLL